MKMIINGQKTDSMSGATFDVIAPATGEVIDSVPKATARGRGKCRNSCRRWSEDLG